MVTVLHTQIPLGKSWSPRSANTPVSTGKTTTSTQIPGPRGSFQNHQDTETKEQPGTGSFWFPSALRSWPCTTALHTQIPPGENWSPRSTDTQVCRREEPQSEIIRPTNTRENQMARVKGKNISNRSQGYLAQNPVLSLLLLSPTSRKERWHSVLLKAVYSGTFQHASRNLSLAPNRNPLYNPSTMPHQPSPCNLSSLAFFKWPDLASWCTCTALTMDVAYFRVYEEVRCKS